MNVKCAWNRVEPYSGDRRCRRGWRALESRGPSGHGGERECRDVSRRALTSKRWGGYARGVGRRGHHRGTVADGQECRDERLCPSGVVDAKVDTDSADLGLCCRGCLPNCRGEGVSRELGNTRGEPATEDATAEGKKAKASAVANGRGLEDLRVGLRKGFEGLLIRPGALPEVRWKNMHASTTRRGVSRVMGVKDRPTRGGEGAPDLFRKGNRLTYAKPFIDGASSTSSSRGAQVLHILQACWVHNAIGRTRFRARLSSLMIVAENAVRRDAQYTIYACQGNRDRGGHVGSGRGPWGCRWNGGGGGGRRRPRGELGRRTGAAFKASWATAWWGRGAFRGVHGRRSARSGLARRRATSRLCGWRRGTGKGRGLRRLARGVRSIAPLRAHDRVRGARYIVAGRRGRGALAAIDDLTSQPGALYRAITADLIFAGHQLCTPAARNIHRDEAPDNRRADRAKFQVLRRTFERALGSGRGNQSIVVAREEGEDDLTSGVGRIAE